jgi:hypothetical protein
MMSEMTPIYGGSNGDRWLLVREAASGRSLVRHEPNPSSGGLASDVEVDEFLARDGQGPQHEALRRLIETPGAWSAARDDQTTSGGMKMLVEIGDPTHDPIYINPDNVVCVQQASEGYVDVVTTAPGTEGPFILRLHGQAKDIVAALRAAD